MIIPRGLPRSRWLLFAPLLGLALSQPAQADALLDDAQTLSAQGNAEQAFVLLGEQEPVRAGDPTFDAAMGRAAYAAGQYPRAVMAWERVFALQPDDAMAQLELGRALLAVGDKRTALAVSKLVREEGIPVDAALNIDQFLVSYDRADYRGASSIKGYAELTVGHDSNANAGPDASDILAVALAGVPAWVLAPGAQETAANFGSALLAVRGRHVLDAGWSLVGAASASTRHHAQAARAYDNSQLDANAGVAWRRERNEVILSGVYGSQLLDDARLRNMGGVQGEWIYRIDGFRQWGSFVQWLDVRYPHQSIRSVHRSIAGVSYSQVFRNGSLAYGSLYGGRESPQTSGVEDLGQHLMGWQLGGQVPLTHSLALFAALSGERRKYGASDPFFAVRRRDQQAGVSLGVSWVPAQDWRITPQWMLVKNDSSIPVTQYERRVISITVRRDF